MKTIKLNIIKVVLVSLSVVSCNDVLDENPDNRTTIDSADKIAELLVGAYPDAGYAPFLEPMSDNAGDKSSSAEVEEEEAETLNEFMFFWQDLNASNIDTPTYFWNRAYKAIAQANQALVSIEELGGGAELNYLKGEALICRAYAHFMLVSIFSKPYNPATAATDIGIPYVTEPETILLGEYERGTVENVYQNIKADIEAGLPLVQDDYTVPAFHFTKKAAHAFASRFYLNTGEWQKVITHATQALGAANAGVLRDWENEYRPKTYSEQNLRFISATAEPANLLLVSANSLYGRYHYSARYQLNTGKRNEIFPSVNDVGLSWSYAIYGSGDLYYNVPKYDEYFKVTNQAAGTGEAYITYVLLTTDEALLNRAEAYAMLEQYDNALSDINLSFSVKTRNYTELTEADIRAGYAVENQSVFAPFYMIPKESLAFVNAVLKMKRTIFYNEGLRWFDIKRLNMEVVHQDIYGNNYVLSNTDNRRQLQIPEAAQSFGIEQNPR
ncbi:MAG: RagB/SusD family nutrient uptake outer membrane protein [Flavobacteriaceae bacterium]